MLLGELGRLPEAEAALRAAVKADPRSAVAAYNLAVVVSRRQARRSRGLEPPRQRTRSRFRRSMPTPPPSTLPSVETSKRPSPCYAVRSTVRPQAPTAIRCSPACLQTQAEKPRPRPCSEAPPLMLASGRLTESRFKRAGRRFP